MKYDYVEETVILNPEKTVEMYKILLENAFDGVAILDENGVIKYQSPAVEKITGYSAGERLGKSAFEFIHPGNIEKIEAFKEELLRNPGVKIKSEACVKSKKGSWIVLEASAVNLLDNPVINGIMINYRDITEKRIADNQLQESEKKFRNVTSLLPVGIFETDIYGNSIYVNKKWCDISGISSQESEGEGWLKSVHPEDRDWVWKGWQNVVKNLEISEAEYRYLSPQGKITWVFGRAIAYRDEQGIKKGFIGTTTDISEIKKMERQLLESESRNKALLAGIPDMIFRVSLDGTYLDFKAANDFNPLIPPEMFIGKKITETLPPEIAGQAMKNLKKAIKTKAVQSFIYSLPNIGNETTVNYFEARIAASGKNEAIVLVRDITKTKVDEIALKKSEEKWRTLVENAPNFIATLDADLRIIFLNHQQQANQQNLQGIKAYETVDIPYQKPLRKLMLGVLKTGIAAEMEFTAQVSEGRRWFLAIYAPIIYEKKITGLMVQAFDISSIKQYEENLQETNQKLYELNQRQENIREEEKKKIAMEIHDELGQELTAMKLSAFWLQQYITEKKLLEMDRDMLMKRLKSLIELSGNTINSVRKIAHELRPVILDSLGLIPAIEWQVSSMNENSEMKCSFLCKIKKPVFSKELSIAIFRIIQESLTNIVRHASASKAEVKMFEKNNRIFLTISDDGKGISDTEINQPGKIGLFGIKERIKNWKGEFLIKGKKDKGTDITISFPLSIVK